MRRARHAIALAATVVVAVVARANAETITVGGCAGSIFPRIQSALDAARPGDTVLVCPGTYPEQLLVTKRLTLRAQPGARIAPVGLTPLAASLRTDHPVAAGVTLRAPARIEGLAIDVGGHGITTCDGAEPLLAGIFVRGVAATIVGTSVVGARLGAEPAGCENGVGIWVEGAGGLQRARLEGNSIAAYQRAGIVLENVGVTARVVENFLTGDGDTPDRMQTGIDVGRGVTARLVDNLVRDHRGPSGAGCELDAGIALRAARARVTGNQLIGNAVGILALSLGHRITANTVDGVPDGLVGLLLDADESRVATNTLGGLAATAIAVPGNRNLLRANAVHDVRAPDCDAARAAPGCRDRLARCGTGLWIQGRANRVVGTAFTSSDVTVVDDGRGNVVR